MTTDDATLPDGVRVAILPAADAQPDPHEDSEPVMATTNWDDANAADHRNDADASTASDAAEATGNGAAEVGHDATDDAEDDRDEDLADEDLADEDLADEDLADEDLADEDLADEDLADEDLADEDLADEDLADEGAVDPPLRPIAALVSFHYLRAAVRRHRPLVAVCALVGMLLGGAFLAVAPAMHTARIGVLLSHASGDDPNRSMATDVALLASRTVAERTVAALQLPMTPESMTKSVTVLPSTSDVVELTMDAPSGAEAVRRLAMFTRQYLDFRATQVSAQTDYVIKGSRARITSLQAQLADLDRRITRLAAGAGTTDQLGDAVSRRSQVADQITTLQDSVDDATLRRSAMVSASRIIDPARTQPSGGMLRVLLAFASGLIGGTALGLAVVVLRALLSDRLRLRVEVATAVEAPVVVSAGRIAPRSGVQRLLLALPPARRRERRRVVDVRRVGGRLSRAVTSSGVPPRLVVAGVDNADEAAVAVLTAAATLQAAGQAVDLVDLTESAALERRARRAARRAADGAAGMPAVRRPEAVLSLASGPPDLAGSGPDAADRGADVAGRAGPGRDGAGGDAAVRFVLADLDPAIGAEHLADWGDRVVVVVTAGRSSVVRLRTAGDLLRSAGLDLHGVVLLRAESDDESSGLPIVDSRPDGGQGAAVIAFGDATPTSSAAGRATRGAPAGMAGGMPGGAVADGGARAAVRRYS